MYLILIDLLASQRPRPATAPLSPLGSPPQSAPEPAARFCLLEGWRKFFSFLSFPSKISLSPLFRSLLMPAWSRILVLWMGNGRIRSGVDEGEQGLEISLRHDRNHVDSRHLRSPAGKSSHLELDLNKLPSTGSPRRPPPPPPRPPAPKDGTFPFWG